jgi:AraC family transcriptional regulator
MTVEAAVSIPAFSAQVVCYSMPRPQVSVLSDPSHYQLNMCLTPRPIDARAGFRRHWGPQRYEPLGEIFLIPPGEELHVRGGRGDQVTLICQFGGPALAGVVARDVEWTSQRLEDALHISNARVRNILLRIAEEVRHPGLGLDQMIDSLARQLMIELGRHFVEIVDRPVTGGLAAWRLRLIDERLSDNPTAPSLTEMADLCGLSVRQLTRGFRVSRGMSLGAYIEQRRMETAKRQILGGESVKAIAFTMGFSSPSSFTFAFRRATGSSPTAFRARQRVSGTRHNF